MGNRDRAKELREKQTQDNEANTKTAMASKKETEVQAESIVKVQEDLENLKLLLADTNEAKDELEQELEEVKKENASLHALVAEKQKQIDSLKAPAKAETKKK
jgi:chromosome segregation ATPase